MTAMHFRIAALVALFKHGAAPTRPEGSRTLQDAEFLARVRAGVELYYANPGFTTSAAAESLRISRMHLNRRLRALTGMSTHAYILDVRLEIARRMLSHSTVPVRLISSRVGFRSPSHFAEAFRKRFGMPPSRFRGLILEHDNEVTKVGRSIDDWSLGEGRQRTL